MEQASVDRASVLGEALSNVIKLSGIKHKDAQDILGVSKGKLRQMQMSGIDPLSKTGELSAYMIRIYRGLSALVGGDKSKIKFWLHTPNQAFSGLAPVERMKTIDGIVDVLHYCDASRGKL